MLSTGHPSSRASVSRFSTQGLKGNQSYLGRAIQPGWGGPFTLGSLCMEEALGSQGTQTPARYTYDFLGLILVASQASSFQGS